MRKLAAVLSLLFAACAANSHYASSKNEKINPQFKGGAGKKVLVIVATADAVGRENLETQFAIEGVERGVELVPSHRLIAKFADLTKESVAEAVKTNSFDRVVVVRGVPKSFKKGEASYASDYYSVIDSYYPMFYDYWGGPTSVVVFSPTQPPPSLTMFNELTVETAMYDVTDASSPWVWKCLTEITTSRQHGDAAKAYVRNVVGRMKSASLL